MFPTCIFEVFDAFDDFRETDEAHEDVLNGVRFAIDEAKL